MHNTDSFLGNALGFLALAALIFSPLLIAGYFILRIILQFVTGLSDGAKEAIDEHREEQQTKEQ